MEKQQKVWNKLYKNKSIEWKKETKEIPKILKGKKVLEIGVGNGKTLASIIKMKPKEIVAIDFSQEAVDICKEKFPEVEVICSDVKSMPFEDGKFEFVIIYFILDSLLDWEIEGAINEIYRVLKKGGRVLFQDFGEGDFRQEGEELEKNTMLKKNGLVCHFFSEREVKRLFNHFNKEKVWETKTYPISYKKHLVRHTVYGEFEK